MFPFVRVAVIMVSLYSNKAVTKTVSLLRVDAEVTPCFLKS